MENARLVRWLKNVGDVVQQGEPLLELETEKSIVEIESTVSGRLVEILLQADQEARVGDRIAWLENDAPGVAAAPVTLPPAPRAMASIPTAPDAHQTGATDRVRSSPVARRFAAEHALDLNRVAGTGPKGRVQLIDAQRAVDAHGTQGTAAAAPPG